MSSRLFVGIDPGVHTGFATWDASNKKLLAVSTTTITQAMLRVDALCRAGVLHCVVFEDARLRTWFGTKGRESLMGAGSIRRDSSIWEEFLSGLVGVPFKPVSPQSKGAKFNAQQFARLTGWTGRTSEHGRDAGMLVFGR